MSKEFLTAVEYVNKLNSTPNNDELLELYKYYKQATIGDNDIQQPSILNIKGRQKWASWNSVKGMNKNNAERQYVILVNGLIKKYGFTS